MNVDCFLDTNILVYAAAGNGRASAKRERTLKLIENENFALSVQVLQEFYVTVTRKLDKVISPETALEWIEQFEAFLCISLETSLIKLGIENSVRYQISYWDGAIVAAAEAAGANYLYSEGLGDGQMYGKVQVVNPLK